MKIFLYYLHFIRRLQQSLIHTICIFLSNIFILIFHNSRMTVKYLIVLFFYSICFLFIVFLEDITPFEIITLCYHLKKTYVCVLHVKFQTYFYYKYNSILNSILMLIVYFSLYQLAKTTVKAKFIEMSLYTSCMLTQIFLLVWMTFLNWNGYHWTKVKKSL